MTTEFVDATLPETDDAPGAEIRVQSVDGTKYGVVTIIAHGEPQEELYYPSLMHAMRATFEPDNYDGPEPIHHEEMFPEHHEPAGKRASTDHVIVQRVERPR